MSDTLTLLRDANPGLNILSVEAPEFRRYGMLLTHYDPAEMIERARAVLPSTDGVVYETSVEALEEPCAFNTAVERQIYGEMPVQVGWCYGRNTRLGALEYHKGTEVNVCLTDVVLLVGHVQDVQWGDEITYDTSLVAAFYAPAGSVIEFPAWNLHYAPIQARRDEQFATLVYLPLGTNEELIHDVPQEGESRLLYAVNKWLLAHPDVEELVDAGAYPGLVGEDIVVRPV